MNNDKYYQEQLTNTVNYLRNKKHVLFLTTSNRWNKEADGELAKSTKLAYAMQKKIGIEKVTLIDVTKLNIYPCEGNVSTEQGNNCGLLKSQLTDTEKNPTGYHRCWASLNHPDDELWQISKELLASDAVVLFVSVRWGQTNSFYQKLIERLTWLENRHSTLGEENILANIDAGIIVVNQNWKGQEVLSTQKKVLEFYGFSVPEELSWNWQYTDEEYDESDKSYQKAAIDFDKTFLKS